MPMAPSTSWAAKPTAMKRTKSPSIAPPWRQLAIAVLSAKDVRRWVDDDAGDASQSRLGARRYHGGFPRRDRIGPAPTSANVCGVRSIPAPQVSLPPAPGRFELFVCPPSQSSNPGSWHSPANYLITLGKSEWVPKEPSEPLQRKPGVRDSFEVSGASSRCTAVREKRLNSWAFQGRSSGGESVAPRHLGGGLVLVGVAWKILGPLWRSPPAARRGRCAACKAVLDVNLEQGGNTKTLVRRHHAKRQSALARGSQLCSN